MIGGGRGIQTPDLDVKSILLYQLSYTPMILFNIVTNPPPVFFRCHRLLLEECGTTARNQTWDSAFAGLCDLHFTTVMLRDPPVQGGYRLTSKRPGLQCRVCVAV